MPLHTRCGYIFSLLSNTMVRVGKSLPATKALSIPTLLRKLDCMQLNCIQSFSGASGKSQGKCIEGAYREWTGRCREDPGRGQLKMRRNFSVRSFFFIGKKNERTPEQLTTHSVILNDSEESLS